MVSRRIQRITTTTYHNVYVIIIVVTAFATMENVMFAIAREDPMFEPHWSRIDNNTKAPTAVPECVWIQQNGLGMTSMKMTIHPRLQSTE